MIDDRFRPDERRGGCETLRGFGWLVEEHVTRVRGMPNRICRPISPVETKYESELHRVRPGAARKIGTISLDPYAGARVFS